MEGKYCDFQYVFVITGHYFILHKKEKPYQFSDVKTEKR